MHSEQSMECVTRPLLSKALVLWRKMAEREEPRVAPQRNAGLNIILTWWRKQRISCILRITFRSYFQQSEERTSSKPPSKALFSHQWRAQGRMMEGAWVEAISCLMCMRYCHVVLTIIIAHIYLSTQIWCLACIIILRTTLSVEKYYPCFRDEETAQKSIVICSRSHHW